MRGFFFRPSLEGGLELLELSSFSCRSSSNTRALQCPDLLALHSNDFKQFFNVISHAPLIQKKSHSARWEKQAGELRPFKLRQHHLGALTELTVFGLAVFQIFCIILRPAIIECPCPSQNQHHEIDHERQVPVACLHQPKELEQHYIHKAPSHKKRYKPPARPSAIPERGRKPKQFCRRTKTVGVAEKSKSSATLTTEKSSNTRPCGSV